ELPPHPGRPRDDAERRRGHPARGHACGDPGRPPASRPRARGRGGRRMSLPRYAFLGPEGTFTEAALRAMVDPSEAEFIPTVDVPAALSAVRNGDADYAVVAIENTVEGGVTATLDTLATGAPLVILGEIVLPVSFELVAPAGTAKETITSVAAHSHGLAQCRRWLADNLPDIAQISAASNASAARELAAGTAAFDAALAPPGLGATLGLEVLASGVADNVN